MLERSIEDSLQKKGQLIVADLDQVIDEVAHEEPSADIDAMEETAEKEVQDEIHFAGEEIKRDIDKDALNIEKEAIHETLGLTVTDQDIQDAQDKNTQTMSKTEKDKIKDNLKNDNTNIEREDKKLTPSNDE